MSKDEKPLEPRQVLFLSYFLDPQSETFSNAYQSAFKAGFSDEYAQNITSIMPSWLSENIGDKRMLDKAERNLNELLDEKRDKRLKLDVSKFVAERLGKDKYSARTEQTGKGGKDLTPTFVVMTSEAKEQLHKLYEGSDSTDN